MKCGGTKLGSEGRGQGERRAEVERRSLWQQLLLYSSRRGILVVTAFDSLPVRFPHVHSRHPGARRPTRGDGESLHARHGTPRNNIQG